MRALILKNAVAALVVAGVWLALETGYFSPDRATRAQTAELESLKQKGRALRAYRADFARDAPGGTEPVAGAAADGLPWGYYNKATRDHVSFDAEGVTLHYRGVPWIGASLRFPGYVPAAAYRIIVRANVAREPGALIVRNRQMDLVRRQIPIGEGETTVYFVAPPGRFDRIVLAFIPESRQRPEGTMRITGVTIDRLER